MNEGHISASRTQSTKQLTPYREVADSSHARAAELEPEVRFFLFHIITSLIPLNCLQLL
jgi:hypothetical protein